MTRSGERRQDPCPAAALPPSNNRPLRSPAQGWQSLDRGQPGAGAGLSCQPAPSSRRTKHRDSHVLSPPAAGTHLLRKQLHADGTATQNIPGGKNRARSCQSWTQPPPTTASEMNQLPRVISDGKTRRKLHHRCLRCLGEQLQTRTGLPSPGQAPGENCCRKQHWRPHRQGQANSYSPP